MKRNKIIYLVIALVTTILAIVIFIQDNSPTKELNSISKSTIEEGKQLSVKYCTTCHTYPEASLLDKETWISQALPNMGPRFGIFSHNGTKYPTEQTANLPKNIYPEKQLLTHEQWQKILDYYEHAAPEKLISPDRKGIVIDELFFEARMPEYRNEAPPMVTAIRLDPGNKTIYFSDAGQNKFYFFNQDLEFSGRFNISSTMSDIRMTNDISTPGRRDLLTTYIGDLSPSDAIKGLIQNIWLNPQTAKGGTGAIMMDSLVRPVESQRVDLNQDGKKDLLINEFGHRTGSLFWLENLGKGTFSKRKVLTYTPGCIESHIMDFTGDGLVDIAVLCSQISQAIYLFENEGQGKFSKKTLLQFEIVAGSSSFKLYDLNKDGHPDILYTSGDNADYSITFKPYHGVYIYLNDGYDNFAKKWFYPINGAYDAVAHDFDQDGNTDIATIAFFADYDTKPEEGFIYFKNEGDLTFTPYHHPAASNGRWIAMDVRDWTGNGRKDIVLANFSLGPTQVKSLIQKNFTEGPHFLLLEN